MKKTSKNQKIIFIDFDYVLLNTKSFRKEYFRGLGVPEKYAQACYDALLYKYGRYDPHPYYLLARQVNPRLQYSKLMRVLRENQSRTKKHIFADCKDFLSFLSRDNWRVELVSSGNYAMQKRKIMGSGLAKFFHRIHIVSKTHEKGGEIAKILNGRNPGFVFIDDVRVIVDDVKKLHPRALVIQMLRYRGMEHSRRVDAIVRNFSEARRVILKYYGKQ